MDGTALSIIDKLTPDQYVMGVCILALVYAVRTLYNRNQDLGNEFAKLVVNNTLVIQELVNELKRKNQ
jgi:hypothetical protein